MLCLWARKCLHMLGVQDLYLHLLGEKKNSSSPTGRRIPVSALIVRLRPSRSGRRKIVSSYAGRRGTWYLHILGKESYVYWTVHHLDSWIKGEKLDVNCFIISLFNAQHVSDVNTSILRSLRLMCWVISWVVLLWFDVCWCYVVVWLWWCGIHMQVSASDRAATGIGTWLYTD